MSQHTKFHRLLFLFHAAVVCGVVRKSCSSISQLPVVEHLRMRGAVFDTFICSGLVTCAKECLSRHACLSFNFNLDDGTCELCGEARPRTNGSEFGPRTNGTVFVTTEASFVFSESHSWPQQILSVCRDHNCPNTTRCVETSDSSWECVLAYCTSPPTVENVNTSSPIGYFTLVNQTLTLECVVGYVACGNVTCNPDGTWTVMTCKPVSKCSEVRQLSSTYTDGEYWLYPQQLNGSRVKVYCHAMNTTPSEYISLTTPYFIAAIQVNNCSWWYPARSYFGYYVFTKFGLDIQNLTINKSDRTFFNKTHGGRAINLDVGTLWGCLPLENSTCWSAGQAVLDLRGTGLGLRDVGVDYYNTSKTYNYSYRNISNVTLSSSNQLVAFRCAAHCEFCFVTVPMYLSVAETDVLPEDSATTPTCG